MHMDEEGSSIFDAISARDDSAVRQLLATQPNAAETPNVQGISPVMLALYQGQTEIAELIAETKQRLTIFEAAGLGRLEDIQNLVSADSDEAQKYSSDGFNAIQLASFFGHPDVVEALVSQGADVDSVATNSMHIRPLHAATAHGHREVIDMLLNAGADVNAQQEGGFTALHEAAHHYDAGLVERLLNAGADPSIRTDEGKSAYDFALESGHEDNRLKT